jgi:mRNA interferase YafQ
LKRARKRGKSIEKIKLTMKLLIDSSNLPEALFDHPFKGDWKGCRDLHIEPDWLLTQFAVAK